MKLFHNKLKKNNKKPYWNNNKIKISYYTLNCTVLKIEQSKHTFSF